MARRKWLDVESVELEITSDDVAGWGYAQWAERPVRVKGAIAGECVTVKPLTVKRGVVQAELRSVLSASAQRTKAFCPAFHRCGGCSNQHFSVADQRQRKEASVLAQLREHNIVPDQVLRPLAGTDRHYRSKARLGVRYLAKARRAFVGFRQTQSNHIADLPGCDVLVPPLARVFPALRDLVESLTLAHAIPQIELAAGASSAALVLRHMLPLTRADIGVLTRFGAEHSIKILTQPGGLETTAVLAPSDADPFLSYDLPSLAAATAEVADSSGVDAGPGTVRNGPIHFSFHPQEFTQVNSEINELMVLQAGAMLGVQPGEKVLDLFCGLGNFTLPMASTGAQVVGIEGSDALVKRAAQNAQANALDAHFAVQDLYKTPDLTAMGKRGFDVVIVDPPRSGLGPLCDALLDFPAGRMLYVSCSPATLVSDCAKLATAGWRVEQYGAVDMFPQTAHVESMVLLTRSGQRDRHDSVNR